MENILDQLDKSGLPYPLCTMVHLSGKCSCCHQETDRFYTFPDCPKYNTVNPMFRCCTNPECFQHVQLGALLGAYNDNMYPNHNFKKRHVLIQRSSGIIQKAVTTNTPVIYCTDNKLVIEAIWNENNTTMSKLVNIDDLYKWNPDLENVEIYIAEDILNYFHTKKTLWFLQNVQSNLKKIDKFIVSKY
jgi:hypothetical protein